MIIKNPILADAVETCIFDYNNRHFDEPEYDIDFSRVIKNDDESLDVADDILNSIDNFRMSINTRYLSQEEIGDVVEELKTVLKAMHLQFFHIQPLSKTGTVPLDLSFLNSLNTDIESISLTNVDLSNASNEIFDRFDSLKQLMLEKCDITDPEIISKVSKDTRISLARNNIAPENFNKAVKFAEESKAGITYSGDLTAIGIVFKNKYIKLSDYLKYKDKVDFSGLPTLKVDVDIDIEPDKTEEIIESLNNLQNVVVESEIGKLRKLDPDGKLTASTRAVIKNASELSVDEIEKRSNITSVRMQDGDNTFLQQGEPYNIEDYKKARQEIDKIIDEVEFPNENDPDREKKIFAQIYKALGKKIRYNHHAISEEGKKDEALQISCRNLTDGLLKNTCVCAGYADILRNCLACAGIYSEYIGANLDLEGGVTVNLDDPQGHAWNKVKLDGEYYWTDLTWDADNILVGRYPLNYCLKSSKDFGHSNYKVGINNEKWAGCDKTVSDEKILELFEGISPEISHADDESKEAEDTTLTKRKSEAVSISMLSSLVLTTAQKGLTAGKLQVMSKEAESLCMVASLPGKTSTDIKLEESDKEV